LFDCGGLRGTVKAVESIELKEATQNTATPNTDRKRQNGQRVLLELRADPTSAAGAHMFRLVSKQGVSNAQAMYVSAENVITERLNPTTVAGNFQGLNWPVVLAGKISNEGEVDYFSIEVPAGRELLFEVDSLGGRLDPVISLSEPTGSWFNSERMTRLAFEDTAGGGMPATASVNYRFKQPGRYVVAVRDFLGMGGADYSYQLRVADGSAQTPKLPTVGKRRGNSATEEWQEREFARKIEPQRLNELWARTLQVSKKQDPASSVPGDTARLSLEASPKVVEHPVSNGPVAVPALSIIREKEPNDRVSEALDVSIPAILEGAVSRPGDVDCYRIKPEAGQPLVFEIQTRSALPPTFSPRLEVFTSSGDEVLNNVYQRIGGDGDDWVQSLEPKVVYTFDRAGEYFLKIRDLTSRNGAPDFAYRVLIRPQIAHVGDIAVKEDRLNLVPGEARKLSISAGQEEGFDGQIVVLVDDLPQGVLALPAADVEPAQGPPWAKVHPERFVSNSQTVTLMILAAPDAPPTERPRLAKIKAQPIVQGKPGTPFEVKELLIMVLNSSL